MSAVPFDPRFPLGTPINRQADQAWQPIAGRPGWLRHRRTGEEVYREPPIKVTRLAI